VSKTIEIIVSPQGDIVGEGWHEGPGTDHAEAMALVGAGHRARGATVVCTLEPCNHFGRTPPCTQALIDAGVARVVVAATDPNLDGDAPGLAELRAAGVEVGTGVLEVEARRQNAAFERHVTTGRPFVILKSAATLDGKTAAVDGSSKWITSPQARADAQRLRAWADAIVAGVRYRTIPWQMGVVTALLRLVPRWLFDRLVANRRQKPRATS